MTKVTAKIRFKTKLLRPGESEGRHLDLSRPAARRQCEVADAEHDDRRWHLEWPRLPGHARTGWPAQSLAQGDQGPARSRRGRGGRHRDAGDRAGGEGTGTQGARRSDAKRWRPILARGRSGQASRRWRDATGSTGSPRARRRKRASGGSSPPATSSPAASAMRAASTGRGCTARATWARPKRRSRPNQGIPPANAKVAGQ